jgi:hypothetical protein
LMRKRSNHCSEEMGGVGKQGEAGADTRFSPGIRP